MADPQARYQDLFDKLRERHFRMTPQRVALLRLLASSESHPSAMALYEALKAEYPTMSLGTVYKTLALLKELDEVLELGFSNDDNRYDGNRPYPHPHLICTRCRKILDPEITMTEDLVNEVSSRYGYRIVSHRLDFYGLCPDCQEKTK